MLRHDELRAQFLCSVTDVAKGPDINRPEYAFIGRSNVGKSSLINFLCRLKDLARVSANPGKTQTLNFYLCEESWHIVDLPGYGFAQVSRDKRVEWTRMIRSYILKRKQLQYVFLLIDARIPPQKLDLDFIKFLGENQVRFVIVLTKADKPSSPDLQRNLGMLKAELQRDWEELPLMMLTSAAKGKGRDELLTFIRESNLQFDNK